MDSSNEIINLVAESGLVTINLSEYIPKGERIIFDLKNNLFKGLILKEKDFRQFIKEHDWKSYAGKHVGIICSADAIVPLWSYMLVASELKQNAETVFFGNEKELNTHLVLNSLNKIDLKPFIDQRVIVKGCGDESINAAVYVEITRLLVPHVKSLMFGEPCSTVPIFKKK